MTIERIDMAPGYRVCRVAKGNWQLSAKHGPPRSRDDAIDDMRRFVEAGINAFDCADHYVGVEETIGEFRRRHPDLARTLRISTKYAPDLDQLHALRRQDVRNIIERSLTRLGVEQLDLVQFHWWDYDVPRYVQTMLWLQELQREGKIAHLGTTNFDVPRLREILDAGVALLSNQLQYSLLDRRPENGMVDLCRERGVHLLCYGTVAGGFLSDRWQGQPDPTPPFANRSLIKYRLIIEEFGGWPAFQRLLEALSTIARKHHSSIAAVAARWVLDRPQVAQALVGARDASHLSDTLDIFRLRLDAEDLARLDPLLRAARGPAGDCYTLERDKDGVHARIMHMNQNTQGAPVHIDMAPPTVAKSVPAATETVTSSHPPDEASTAHLGDEFELYDLRVEVVESERPFVMHVKKGDTFDVIGGRLVFPPDNPGFSLYGLLAVLPFIPAKQRPTHPHDWMTSDCLIAATDPACGARFKITRLRKRTLHHADFSVVPLGGTNGEPDPV